VCHGADNITDKTKAMCQHTLHRETIQTRQVMRPLSMLAGRLLMLKHGQSPQLTLDVLKRREANADGDGTFDPVHAEPFVQALHDTFCLHNVPQ